METTNLNIIMVDDNVQFRARLKTYLETELGHHVIAEASSGKEFLELPELMNADIILMDIAMQELNGIEATKMALWYKNSKLKIIALTMEVEQMFLLLLVQTGFKGCVYKPNIMSGLPGALRKVVDGSLSFPDEIPIFYPSKSENK